MCFLASYNHLEGRAGEGAQHCSLIFWWETGFCEELDLDLDPSPRLDSWTLPLRNVLVTSPELQKNKN